MKLVIFYDAKILVFYAPTVWNALPLEICASPLPESSLKPTYTPGHPHLSLNHPQALSVVPDLFSVPGY